MLISCGCTQACRSSALAQQWEFTSSMGRRYGSIMMTSSHSAHRLLIPPPPRKKSVHDCHHSETVVDIVEYNNLENAELQPTRHNQTFDSTAGEMGSVQRCPGGGGGGTHGLWLPMNKAHFRQTDYGVYYNLHIIHFTPVFISCIIRYNPI